LDELFEALTWRQLGLHEKPILLLNTNGYWDPLIKLMNHVVTQAFADASLLDYITVVPDTVAATAALRVALS
jgi:predicted Rossmann-fold nucleotide-binding protein